MGNTYPSKVDWWLAVVLVIGGVAPILVVWMAAEATRQYAVLPLGFIPLAIYGTLVFPCRYSFETTELVVQSGFIRYRIPYSSISGWEKTHNPLSSPALSLDRLRIDYANRSLMVSPLRQEEFIEELKVRTAKTLRRNL